MKFTFKALKAKTKTWPVGIRGGNSDATGYVSIKKAIRPSRTTPISSSFPAPPVNDDASSSIYTSSSTSPRPIPASRYSASEYSRLLDNDDEKATISNSFSDLSTKQTATLELPLLPDNDDESALSYSALPDTDDEPTLSNSEQDRTCADYTLVSPRESFRDELNPISNLDFNTVLHVSSPRETFPGTTPTAEYLAKYRRIGNQQGISRVVTVPVAPLSTTVKKFELLPRAATMPIQTPLWPVRRTRAITIEEQPVRRKPVVMTEEQHAILNVKWKEMRQHPSPIHVHNTLCPHWRHGDEHGLARPECDLEKTYTLFDINPFTKLGVKHKELLMVRDKHAKWLREEQKETGEAASATMRM
jgi:hypothetical protein